MIIELSIAKVLTAFAISFMGCWASNFVNHVRGSTRDLVPLTIVTVLIVVFA